MVHTHPGELSLPRARRAAAVLAGLLALAGCRTAPKPPEPPAATREWQAFEGTWTASGRRRTLLLGGDRRASIGELSGSLVLTGATRPAVGFKAEALLFYDSAEGMTGRSVWTDEQGDQVFSRLEGNGTASGRWVTGTILGGTGRYQNIEGTYGFSWRFVLESPDGAMSGQSVGFKGRVRAGSPPAAPAPPGPRP